MKINGVWVGWGLGDWSHNPDGTDRDPTVRNFKSFARRMYRSYMGDLEDTNKFDSQTYDRVCMMQDRLVNSEQLMVGRFIRGVLDLETEYASKFKKRPSAPKPIIFTVEGHQSNMFFGPAAANAQTLEAQGICHAKPIGYMSNDLPFNNQSGVNELVLQVNSQFIEGPPGPNGKPIMWPFPIELGWGIVGFSQGAMVISEFMEREVLNPKGRCHWRLPSFKRGLAIGNPRREYDKIASWADNPPEANTQGIMGDMTGKGTFVTTGTVLESRWQENANDNDMFSENRRDKAGMDKTAIAKIITENSWVGGQASIFARVLALFGNPVGESFVAIKASFEAIIFLASNPNPHYTTVTEPGDIEWMKGVTL